MNTLIVVNTIWAAMHPRRGGGVGCVRPSDVEDMLIGHPTGITRYRVRKMFSDMRSSGLLEFRGNHYTIDLQSDVITDLLNAVEEIAR